MYLKTVKNWMRTCIRVQKNTLKIYYNLGMSPSLRIGKLFSFNSQFVLAKTFLSKRSFGNYSFFKVSSKWISQVMNLVFGLALWKALVPFRHDVTGSSGFSADAHRHQVSFGLPFVTFPKVREGVFPSTRNLFLLKLSWVKGFLVTICSSKWIVKYFWNVFGLAHCRAFHSLQTWSSW